MRTVKEFIVYRLLFMFFDFTLDFRWIFETRSVEIILIVLAYFRLDFAWILKSCPKSSVSIRIIRG